jgi:predicted secreted hydrolase
MSRTGLRILAILKRIIPILVILALLGTGSWYLLRPTVQAPVQASLSGFPLTSLPADFQRAEGPREFIFPQDYGAHNDFQTEWWYYTGNLQAADGRQYGYQLTFFRRALLPADERPVRSSDWATEQVYMAHFTITDVAAGDFHYWERFSRGSAGLAGAQGDPAFQVWLSDWQVVQTSPGNYTLHAAQDGFTLDLVLIDEKGPVLQGDHGYSQKGPQPGIASYYFSQTDLASTGSIQLGNSSIQVNGKSWMDHEFSTSALANHQVGWDWFSIQLNDNREIMLYTIRNQDGSIDPYSSGAIVEQDGSLSPLKQSDFSISIDRYWHSPTSGAEYPMQWKIEIPSQQLEIEINPLMENQELKVSFTYWEGAVKVGAIWAGKPVSGKGYVEMTGYAGSMQGQF